MSFSGSYERPKLIESKIVRKIIDTQVIEIPTEQKIFNNIMLFLFNNWQMILLTIIICGALFWRYKETKKKKELEQQYYDLLN